MNDQTVTLQISVTVSVHDLAGVLAMFEGVRGVRTVANPALAPNSGTEAARAVLAPPAAPPAGILVRDERDYFTRDRKGNAPSLPPDGAELKTLTVLQAKESADKKYLTVVFQGGKANCFDPALWPRIVKGASQQALWLTKSDKYINIVGVRA